MDKDTIILAQKPFKEAICNLGEIFSCWFQDFDDDDDDDIEEPYNKGNGGVSCFYHHICSSDGTQSTPTSPWKSKPSIGKWHDIKVFFLPEKRHFKLEFIGVSIS